MNAIATEFMELGLPSISLKLKRTDEGKEFIGIGSHADEVLIANNVRVSLDVTANGGDDRILGGKGDDVIRGGRGDDYLHGFKGNDFLYGGRGNDRLFGEGGSDVLYGGAGGDFLSGGKNYDYLSGGNGHDSLIGGLGTDTLIGGEGNDSFLIGGKELIGDTEDEGDLDFVLDFTQGEDHIFVFADSVVVAQAHISDYDTPDAVLVTNGNYSLVLDGFTGQLTSADFTLANKIEFAEAPVFV